MQQQSRTLEMRDRIPPPGLENLCKLQLNRTAIVNFIGWKNFDEVVQGCYVRVLLELRHDERQREAVHDSYYIAAVKGARKGPSYSGFSCDGLATEWHILIDLPPCFRTTPNGNVVQLNSISNSPFKPQEYQAWVDMTRESSQRFMSLSQIELRLTLLEEHKMQANIYGTPQPKKRRTDEDDESIAAKEALVQALKDEVVSEIEKTHTFLPHANQIPKLGVEALEEVEREVLDRISEVRMAINEKTKCRHCRNHLCSIICYPCKHQVLCRECSVSVNVCPAPDCGKVVQEMLEAYTS